MENKLLKYGNGRQSKEMLKIMIDVHKTIRENDRAPLTGVMDSLFRPIQNFEINTYITVCRWLVLPLLRMADHITS